MTFNEMMKQAKSVEVCKGEKLLCVTLEDGTCVYVGQSDRQVDAESNEVEIFR